jgi:hypothetical protein
LTYDWIGLGGLVGVASLAYTIYSNRRERAAREADLAREQENRREEIELLRQQVAMERQERDQRRNAFITAVRARTSGAGQVDAYTFKLANTGGGHARRVHAQIVDVDGNLLTRSEPLTAPVLRPTEDAEITLHAASLAIEQSAGAFLHVSWEDENGLHAENILGVKPIR